MTNREIIGYGIGQYYEHVKNKLSDKIKISYLCDARWQEYDGKYDGIPVISPEEAAQHKDALFVVFSGNARNSNSIYSVLSKWQVQYVHAKSFITLGNEITGEFLKKGNYSGHYSDEFGNTIDFYDDIENSVTITFLDSNNHVRIGHSVSCGSLKITCGRDSEFEIGERTMIEGALAYISSGSIIIGKDCLFSYNVIIRNHDTHHIFLASTGERINYSGNISIGNHVWVGYGATLLGNFSIGDNSIVGTMAVTSSHFPGQVIIAGNPAKVVREGVCWSKDNTDFFNRERLEDCISKEAYEYF